MKKREMTEKRGKEIRHTPGPWIHNPNVPGSITLPNRADCPPVAWVGGFQGGNGPDWAKANAVLIAAAPKLLAALRELVEIEWAQDPESRNVHDETLEAYDAIIREAEGRA